MTTWTKNDAISVYHMTARHNDDLNQKW